MSEPKVVINKVSGNLNSPAQGADFVSGMIFYTSVVPSGQSASYTDVYGSIQDAIAQNITATATSLDVQYAYWQIYEYFRLNPTGKLYIMFSSSVSYNFNEIQTLQNISNGIIKQISIFTYARALNTADITAIQLVITTISNLYAPLYAIYAPNVQTTVVSGLTSLRAGAFVCPNVSCVIADDSGTVGSLFTGYTFTAGGMVLGRLSAIGVNKSIAEVGVGTVSDGTNTWYNPLICNTPYNLEFTDTLRNQLYDYGYILVKKFPGKDGSYLNGETNANLATADTDNKISRERTFDKIKVITYQQVLPFLESTLNLNDDGMMNINSIDIK